MSSVFLTLKIFKCWVFSCEIKFPSICQINNLFPINQLIIDISLFLNIMCNIHFHKFSLTPSFSSQHSVNVSKPLQQTTLAVCVTKFNYEKDYMKHAEASFVTPHPLRYVLKQITYLSKIRNYNLTGKSIYIVKAVMIIQLTDISKWSGLLIFNHTGQGRQLQHDWITEYQRLYKTRVI